VRFARPHPSHVSLECVYLTIVAEQAKRLDAFPGRKGVRAVALMKERQRRFVSRFAQIGIKGANWVETNNPL
jgi:hypothetical protein